MHLRHRSFRRTSIMISSGLFDVIGGQAVTHIEASCERYISISDMNVLLHPMLTLN